MPYTFRDSVELARKRTITKDYAIATGCPQTIPDPANPGQVIPQTNAGYAKWMDRHVDSHVMGVVRAYRRQQAEASVDAAAVADMGDLVTPE